MSGLTRTRWAAVGAAVAVTLGAGGIGLTHAVIDSGAKSVFVPIEPCRLTDTRSGPLDDTIGSRNTPLPPGTPITFDAFGANGNCNLPASFTAISLNVTPVNATANTDIRLYPTGGTVPLVSNLNPEAGTLPVPNAVNVGVSDAGRFDVLNKFGTVDIVMDVVGYYDDHNHDDRYPTAVYSAVVSETGALVRGVGATGAAADSTGRYNVAFDRDVSECAFNATAGQVGDDGSVGNRIATVAGQNGVPSGVNVVTLDPANAVEVDTPFHLTVVCDAGT